VSVNGVSEVALHARSYGFILARSHLELVWGAKFGGGAGLKVVGG
jgi:hypothetical protein